MHDKTKTGAAASTAADGVAGGVPVKEKIFSLIRKASVEGITDGRRWLWIGFTPHIVAEEKEDGYIVWLWREGVVIKITLDKELNVTGFDVEVRP
jgi:hypothetical protein